MAAIEPDFDALYRDLGITAQCALPAFKQRYRRRVAQLHPDRGGGTRNAEALKMLNQRYSAALAFQRRHGCLPGAVDDAGAARPVRIPTADAPAIEQRPTMRIRALLALFAATALVIWIEVSWTAPAPNATDSHLQSRARTTELPVLSASATSVSTVWMPARLRPGMSPAQVRAQLGEPFGSGDNTLWFYGPSWLRFECNQLMEWYSSPLAPLRTQVAATDDDAAEPVSTWAHCGSAEPKAAQAPAPANPTGAIH
ncbi:hypothetical protein [Luteimonas mephitis]|uniref:hypothetical protein n=1 Tax=Luteimonas mephitis TaxID=83615 RepID=UPI003A8E5573